LFTGIVEEMGYLVESTPIQMSFTAKKVLDGTQVGDSIAINGTCLTIVSINKGIIVTDVTPETRKCTNLGNITIGETVNLERAVEMGKRLGGHLMQGHVEGVGKILSLQSNNDSLIINMKAPKELMRYIVGKGFISVDGISLTVTKCAASSFEIAVIPYTFGHTNLGSKKVGDTVNLETDIIGRYVEKLIEAPKN
jgi:riboflavin synthase